MSRKTSFKEQMFRILNSKNAFGQSKYLAKQESYRQGNKGKVDGIYSKKTMKDYKAVAEQFNSWQKDKGYNFHSINDVTQSVIVEFLKDKQDKNYSSWSISRDQSALNKIFNLSITKKDNGLNSRHNDDIKNNRGLANNYRYSTLARNKEIISFITASGVRRQSLTVIRPHDIIRNADNVVIGVKVIEKGGRSRNAYIRNEFQTQITAFVDNHISAKGNQPFWNKVDKNLNTHWYRAEYANGLYLSLLNAKNSNTDYFKGYRDCFINERNFQNAIKGKKDTIKGYDTESLALVSQSLGHSRVDVVYII